MYPISDELICVMWYHQRNKPALQYKDIHLEIPFLTTLQFDKNRNINQVLQVNAYELNKTSRIHPSMYFESSVWLSRMENGLHASTCRAVTHNGTTHTR